MARIMVCDICKNQMSQSEGLRLVFPYLLYDDRRPREKPSLVPKELDVCRECCDKIVEHMAGVKDLILHRR